jgi:hypothetical protein
VKADDGYSAAWVARAVRPLSGWALDLRAAQLGPDHPEVRVLVRTWLGPSRLPGVPPIR